MLKFPMKKFFTFNTITGLIIVIFSLTALYASLTLSIEYLEVLKNPEVVLSCNLNSAINCTSVMKSWQAELLGFPNTYFGLIGYGATLALGALLLFKKELGKWINLLSLLGSFTAFLFSYWLLWQSAFAIGALCIYCIISCISASNIFFAFLLLNLKENTFDFSEKLNDKINRFINKNYYWILIAIWYLVVTATILIEFQDSFIQ